LEEVLTQPFHQISCFEETGKSFDVSPFLEGTAGLLEDLFVEILQLFDGHPVSIDLSKVCQ
jgi:hypothetical protein